MPTFTTRTIDGKHGAVPYRGTATMHLFPRGPASAASYSGAVEWARTTDIPVSEDLAAAISDLPSQLLFQLSYNCKLVEETGLEPALTNTSEA
jgi:hypothetical protein